MATRKTVAVKTFGVFNKSIAKNMRASGWKARAQRSDAGKKRKKS